MTMADEVDPVGNMRQVTDYQISNNNNSLTTNQNIPWKQRKRKRLSAVLDKLHNNNTITKSFLNELDVITESNNNNNNINSNNKNVNNNQGESSTKDHHHQLHRSLVDRDIGCQSVKSSGDEDDDRTTIASDDLRSSVESPIVKREFSSPIHFNVTDENGIKQEDRASDYEYNRNEQNHSPMELYFPQMSSPLFEYYLQTKYFPDILRLRNNLQIPDVQQMKLMQQQQHQQQHSPQNQLAAIDLQQKPHKKDEDTKMRQRQNACRSPTRKRQRQPKQQQQYQLYADKQQQEQQQQPPPPPQDAPLDLSMKTILENITKATATHKQTRTPSSVSSLASSSITSAHNQWQNQTPQDLSTTSSSHPANILVNSHLNNHQFVPTTAAAHRQQSPITSTSSNSLGQVPIIKGDVASPTTKESVAFRYNINVSPVVEEMPPGTDVAYVCPICGQMFSLHDRLAKHMASRHKSKSNSSEITKSYVCEVCDRSFARSDMLTRHMRLHTGIKPYTCKVCSQVFSRSDHLSTHQRTHTGEKPYKCPQCPYAACRRDMITRHMRTHARYEAQRAAAASAAAANSLESTTKNFQRTTLSPNTDFSKVKIKIEESNQTVSPKAISPAYATNTMIKTENTLLKIQ